MPVLESPDKKIEVTFQRLRVTDHLTQTTHTCLITLTAPKGSLNFRFFIIKIFSSEKAFIASRRSAFLVVLVI